MNVPNNTPICNTCKSDRINHGKEPRQLVSVQVPGSKYPYWLCSFCDGDAMVAAKTLESERLAGH